MITLCVEFTDFDSGEKLNAEKYAFSNIESEKIVSSDYVRLSNKLLASNFNPFDTAYKEIPKYWDEICLLLNHRVFVNGY